MEKSVINPSRKYWYERSDGVISGETKPRHEFNVDDQYFINRIPAVRKKECSIPLFRKLCCKKHPDYFNAEIYNSPEISTVATPELTKYPWNIIQNKTLVDNPADPSEWKNYKEDLIFNVPFSAEAKITFSSRIRVTNLKGGSRGWGFWNTSTSLTGNNTSWFIQLAGNSDYQLNGFWAVTQKGLNISMIKLSDLDEQWHDYKIILTDKSAEYYVDNKPVHKEENIYCIPDSPMAFHNWVDNAVFSVGPSGIIHLTNYTNESRENHMKNMEILYG